MDTELLGVIVLCVLAASAVSMVLIITLSVVFPASPAQLTRTIRERSWRSGQVGLVLATFIGAALLVSFIQPVVNHSDHPAGRLVSVLVFAALQVALLLFIARNRKSGWHQDFGMRLRELKRLPLSLAIYLAMLPVIGIVTAIYHAILTQKFGIETDMQEVAQLIAESRSWTKAGFLLLAVAIAPLYEELIFRGVFFSYLTRRVGLIGAIAAVSLIFALIHFHIPSMLPLFLLSVVLCLAYWRTGSLWTNIGIHAIFNGVTVLILLLVA